jgi:hypothetical protein
MLVSCESRRCRGHGLLFMHVVTVLLSIARAAAKLPKQMLRKQSPGTLCACDVHTSPDSIVLCSNDAISTAHWQLDIFHAFLSAQFETIQCDVIVM